MSGPVPSSPFTEIHGELRAVARDLLVGAGPLDSGEGTSIPLDWGKLAQAGWTGLEVPGHLDGAGATIEEVAIVLHEMGRSAALSPYLGTVVIGAGLLGALAPSQRRDDLLRQVAAGATRVAVAIDAGGDDGARPGQPFTLSGGSGSWRLDGHASFVPDASDADVLLLPASGPDAAGVVVAVRGAGGLSVTGRPVVDPTRFLADVAASSVAVDDDALMTLPGGIDIATAMGQAHDRAAFALACDSLGIAEAMVETTVAYVGVRRQFDRPIGSFQAVKHACSDMLIQVKVGEQLVAAAAKALAAGHPDAWVAVSQAKSHVGAAAVDVAGKAMQLHGGIGYTWESGIHAYLKRAALNRSLFGSPAEHRKRLAERYR